MRVALVQFASDVDAATNRERIGASLAALEGPDAPDLVVLPEASMHDFGAPDHDLATVAETVDGPFVALLAEHAGRLGATVVAGMFESTDGLPYNTVVAVGPDGNVVATYRKIHLYDSFGYRESDRLTPGVIEPALFDVAGLRVGLMTCYDLRFPEHARALVDGGADGFVLPAAWVAGERKIHHWRTLLAARAIENTAFVLAAAQAGPRYEGHSTIIGPLGDVLAEAGSDPAVVVGEVVPEAVGRAREINPALEHRRFPR